MPSTEELQARNTGEPVFFTLASYGGSEPVHVVNRSHGGSTPIGVRTGGVGGAIPVYESATGRPVYIIGPGSTAPINPNPPGPPPAQLLDSVDFTDSGDVDSFARPVAAGYTGSGDSATFQREAAVDVLRSDHYQSSQGPLVIIQDSPTSCVLVAPGSINVTTPTDFKFSASWAAIPVTVSLLRYEYRLDSTGSWTTNGTSLTLTDIPADPGDHILNVRAVSTSGVLGTTGNSSTFTVTGVAPPSDYVLQWKLNGNANDTTGTFNGTWVGSEAYTTGQDGLSNHAASLNGSSIVVNATAANFTSGAFSLSGWFWINTGTLSGSPVLFWKGAYEVGGYYSGLQTDGQLYFITSQSGAHQVSTTNAGAVAENGWHHVAITRSGASVKLYVDGTDVTTTSGTHVNPATSASSFVAGAYNDSSSSNFVTGKLDDVRVYDYELDSGQVSALNTAGAQ